MSQTEIFPKPDGATYTIPDVDDTGWGQNVTNFLLAIANGVIPRSGSYGFTGDVTITGGFGFILPYLKTTSALIATAGQVRLAKTDLIEWRNHDNSGNLTLGVDGSDHLIFNGIDISALTALTDSHIFVGNGSNIPTDVSMSGDVHISNTGVTTIQTGVVTAAKIANDTITNTQINSAAAIAYSKLALTGSIVNADINASAAIAVSKLASLGGSTNAVVTQDSGGHIQASSILSSSLFLKDGSITATGDFNMGSHKISSVTNPLSAQDVATKAYVDALVGGGGIFQIVTASTSTPVTTASSTMQATNLTASITPSDALHSILIFAAGSWKVPDSGGTGGVARATIFRDSTNLAGTSNTPFIAADAHTGGSNPNIYPLTLVYYDSPATTSAITYTIKICDTGGDSTSFPAISGNKAFLILIEI